MNINMWEDLKERIKRHVPLFPGESMMKDNVLEMMRLLEEENKVSLDPSLIEKMTRFLDVDGVTSMEILFPDGCPAACTVFYDNTVESMRSQHWKTILSDVAREIDHDMDLAVDYIYRECPMSRKKRNRRRYRNG